jgi:hypothetical protein
MSPNKAPLGGYPGGRTSYSNHSSKTGESPHGADTTGVSWLGPVCMGWLVGKELLLSANLVGLISQKCANRAPGTQGISAA